MGQDSSFKWHVKKGEVMAKCIYCGANTIMHVNGNPVCIKCDKTRNNTEKPTLKSPNRETEIVTKKEVA